MKNELRILDIENRGDRYLINLMYEDSLECEAVFISKEKLFALIADAERERSPSES